MNTLTYIAVGGLAFLVADRVAKKLPATAGWALGWGTVATLGSYTVGNAIMKHEDAAFHSGIAATGVALGYLHAYTHQTPFPHRNELMK